MAASVNKVMLVGNLGQDPEMRYTANQTPVVTMNIATTEYRQTADGQKQEQTEWHRVVVWSKMAENCAKYLAKGRTVFVEGKLQTRSWDDKTSGQKRYMTEIVAQNIQFLGGNPTSRSNSMPQSNDGSSIPDFDLGPAPSASSGPSGFNQDQQVDDIPF